ncbi:MAG: sulfur reduction protein DsrE [Chitinophagaceae bacterium]|nr:sulfur reduction protein DsrE [Chitinophagaceae bacterium]
MRKSTYLFLLSAISLFTTSQATAQSGAPVIKEADGFTVIPHVAVPPDKKHVYRAVYDATKAAKQPAELIPALNMAGSELNALAVSNIPLTNAKFILVFHGAAINGILDDAHYKSKFGISNPNLVVLSKLKQAGVKNFVCGQNLLGENIDPKTISKDVTVASDALIVLMAYQNEGYALISF